METMTCDVAIKMYDRCKDYDDNVKGPELYLIPDAKVKQGDGSGTMTLDAARMEVHDFVSNFLDGGASSKSSRLFQGTDMKFQGTTTSAYYWADTIIIYVNVTVPREKVEDLVIALAEEFGGKEAAIEV